jgi:hypothetical protein
VTKSEIDWLAGDIHALRLVAVRLGARLSGGVLATIGPEAAAVALPSLSALRPVLAALDRNLEAACASTTRPTDEEAA